jgi:hypothetical protein
MTLTSKAKAIIFLEEIQKHFLIKRFGTLYLEKFDEIKQITNNPESLVDFSKKLFKEEVDQIKIKDLYNKKIISDRII